MTPAQTNIELIDYKFQTMQKALDTHQEFTKWEFQSLRKEMKESNESIHDKLDKFIEWANKQFVREEELIPIKEKQKTHDDIIARIAWASFFWFLAIIWWIIWISKYM